MTPLSGRTKSSLGTIESEWVNYFGSGRSGQDGVSANSTTSALCKPHALNRLGISGSEGVSGCTNLHQHFCALPESPSGADSSASQNSFSTASSRGCTSRMLILMLSCPATSCNVTGLLAASGQERVSPMPRSCAELTPAVLAFGTTGRGSVLTCTQG
jgi:hypothetical protein